MKAMACQTQVGSQAGCLTFLGPRAEGGPGKQEGQGDSREVSCAHSDHPKVSGSGRFLDHLSSHSTQLFLQL